MILCGRGVGFFSDSSGAVNGFTLTILVYFYGVCCLLVYCALPVHLHLFVSHLDPWRDDPVYKTDEEDDDEEEVIHKLFIIFTLPVPLFFFYQIIIMLFKSKNK
jgi:hypothetical protein